MLTACAQKAPDYRWAVHYGGSADRLPSTLRFVVVDSENHPPLEELRARGLKIYAYLSIGQAENHRDYFADAVSGGVLVAEDVRWPGSHTVDLRNPNWTNIVIHDRLASIKSQGFDGIFLDTVDQPIALEAQDPVRFLGMRSAAIWLVREVARQAPGLDLMLNRGFDIVDEVAADIHILVGESTLTYFDEARQDYFWRDPVASQEEIQFLKTAHQRHSHLRILTVDYWRPDELKVARKIFRLQRGHGFEPFVGDVFLGARD